MPVKPLGDDENMTRYKATYFADFPGVWRQGDFFKVNERGGCFVLGRSDATLNRHGIRIGTAEVYAALESVAELTGALIVNLDLPGGGFFMPLFVTLDDGAVLDDALRRTITDRLRSQYTARHVPDRIVQVPEIPVTLTGKKMEVPVRRILRGAPAYQAANRNAMANPSSLYFFADYAATQPYLLYTGLMSYDPNVGAVRHFVAEVLPLIRQEINAAFHIVGAGPTEEVQALASESVIVHGSVPDMRPYFDAAMAVVVPLLEGGGTRLKILEAAASGKAIVSTSLGAEGLNLRHDEDLLIADSAPEFAAAVIRLCKDAGLRWRLGQQARSASL